MNDDHTLAIIRDRLTQARDGLGDVPGPIPAGKIIARAGQRRARHRLAAAGAACAAAGLATALILAPGSPARPAPRPGPGHAQLAAWTVQANPDGTVTFTLRNTSHPAQLEHALAKAGVPAVVRWGKICEAGGPGQPLIDTSGFVTGNNMFTADTASFFAANGGQGKNVDLGWSWTIIPGKIPHGGHFVISAMPGPVPADDFQAVWEFAHTSAPITCAKHVDK
jgi:hypothetical protein